ncbi:DUF72 domain-containing protein [Psychrobacter lutiphocae]|uniref:DUF72 domain-containing protein n=1 Tax=Psychrobacter lutiphocae TaxID=540500 RepID=UPI000365D957|nr:DUF72 domain-containing protein [Psychrobacter lutiphocae]
MSNFPQIQSATYPTIYLGTGGYSDTDLLGTLYPLGTKKADFLTAYAKQYKAVEINSSFYAPLGHKAYAGMVRKSDAQIKFAIKLHQDFSHTLKATPKHATAFIDALQPIIEANCLAPLLIQFPHGFDRTRNNRLYLAQLVDWFADFDLAIEFRHPSWHTPQVEHSFQDFGLIWCSVDYPQVSGLPKSKLLFTQTNLENSNALAKTRKGYLRLHGNNLNWWDAISANERHDYRYSVVEMQAWAQAIANQRQHFDELYIFFQNTTKAHAYYNIQMLRDALLDLSFTVL